MYCAATGAEPVPRVMEKADRENNKESEGQNAGGTYCMSDTKHPRCNIHTSSLHGGFVWWTVLLSTF